MEERVKKFKLQIYKDNKLNLVMTILVCLLTTLFNLAIAFLLKDLTDIAFSGTTKDLKHLVLSYLALIGFLVVVLLISRHFKNNYIKNAVYHYKKFAFDKLLQKNINNFDKEVTGKYISIFTNDIESISTYYISGKMNIIVQVMTFIGGIAAMAYLNWILTICVLGVSLLPMLVSVIFSNTLQKNEKEVSDRNESFMSLIKDLMTGFSVIKSFQAEKEVGEIFNKKNEVLEKTKRNRRKTGDLISMASTVASSLVELVIFGVGVYLSIKGKITAGTVIAFVQLLNFVLGPIGQLSSLVTAKKAAEVLIRKMAEATFIEEETGKEEKEEFHKEIAFDNVTFGYEEEHPILQNINLKFEEGKSYVIVGASGSGKSTLVNLMLGRYDTYDGTIKIDDTNLKNLSGKSICELYSVIQQNVFIFDDTIATNITMYKNFPDEIVNQAIVQSGLAKLIEEKGIDYHCGENGAFLSGGEKQRISIARSLIRNTPILVMDEATSALDPVTARMVEEAIACCDSLTRIVISHKLDESILRMYDSIIVLNNGSVIENGSFDQLIKERGYFFSLYQVENSMA